MSVRLQVYRATAQDRPRILKLLNKARRSYVAFGQEDLSHLLASGNCMVAADGDRLWAFLAVSIASRQDAAGKQLRWAYLRGAAITDGWRADDGLGALLPSLIDHLLEVQASHLAVYGTALWLVPALMRAGFQRLEWIITLERHPRPLPHHPLKPAGLRPVAAADLSRLAQLDAVAFPPAYQLASGELIELMITSGHFVVAQLDRHDGLAGYVCSDVQDDEGQIIRLAVHPLARRQGIGRALLNDALAYCSASQAERVVINTQETNIASLMLYEQLGFRRVGRRVPLLVRDLLAKVQE